MSVRRTKMKRCSVISVLSLAALACGCSKVPKEVIPPEEMAQLMADVYTGEAYIDMNRGSFYNDSTRQVVQQSVYAKYGVTPEQVDSSFGWYGRNIDKYMDVYDRTIEILEHRLIETGNRIAAENALSIAGDSVDVWPNPRFMTFNAKLPSPVATFSFASDDNWERGDSYTWRAKFFNNNGLSRWSIVAEYDDGEVQFATKNISTDGWSEIVLSTDSTRSVQRLYGYLTASYPDGSSMRIDSMSMVRKRINPHNYFLPNRSFRFPGLGTPADSTKKE